MKISLGGASGPACSSPAACPRAEVDPETAWLSLPPEAQSRARGRKQLAQFHHQGLTILQWYTLPWFYCWKLTQDHSFPEAWLGAGHKAYVPGHSAIFPDKIILKHQPSQDQDIVSETQGTLELLIGPT